MRQPRRVPWSSKAELGELYELLFSPSANDDSRAAGLSRVSAILSALRIEELHPSSSSTSCLHPSFQLVTVLCGYNITFRLPSFSFAANHR